MKKKLFLMACLAVVGILRVKAQQSIIALHHEGNVTIYAGAKTQVAMDASVKGDTLYLSEGSFAGFNVTHGIVVLGSGEKTNVAGNITIIGNKEKLDLGGYVFSGLNMLHDFVVNDSVNGLRVSQCQMPNFKVNTDIFLDNAEIVICRISNTLSIGGAEYGLSVINSAILNVDYAGESYGCVVFNHCNISWAGHNNSMDHSKYNTYYNCILHRVDYATCFNCIVNEKYYNPTLVDCYEIGGWTNDKYYSPGFSDDSLRTAGYIGNDGTVVGITGGECPYTLELAAPHVVDHKVEVDNVNRKMTVTLKMAHEATKEEE